MRHRILHVSTRRTPMHDRLGRLLVMCSILVVLLVVDAASATPPGPCAKEALAALETALDEGDAEAFSDSVSEMCRYDSRRRMLSLLVRGLKHEDTDVRRAAARGLASLGTLAAPAARMVIPMLASSEAPVQTRTERTLVGMGEKALPSLVSALDDPQAEIRVGACRVLEAIGVPQETAVPGLVKGLADENWEVRYFAASALAVVAPKSQAAMTALKRAREAEEDEYGRTNMDYAMGAIDPERAESRAVVEALASSALYGDGEQANVAQRALRRLGPAGRKTLARLLVAPAEQGGGEEPEDRTWCAQALALVGPPAFSELPALEAALNDASHEKRVAAAVAIWSLGGPLEKAQDVLLDLVKHGEGHVRHAAAMGLGTFGPQAEEAVPVLLEAAEDESFVPTAGMALAMISPEAVQLVPKLVKIIRRRGEDTDDAATALLFLGRPVAPVLGGMLSSDIASDRRAAMVLLLGLGRDAAPAVQAIADSLNAPSDNLRADVLDLLATIGPEAAPAIPALIEYGEREAREEPSKFGWEVPCAQVLWKLGPAGKKALAEQLAPHRESILHELTPPFDYEAAGAALALAASRPPLDQAVPALSEMLAAEDVVVRVVAASALLVLESNVDQALPVLKDALDCPCQIVRAQTLGLLEHLGSAAGPAAPIIAATLDRKAPEMRFYVTQTLWHIAPDHPAIVPSLRELLESRPQTYLGRNSLELIVEMKTAARPLLPTLKRILPLANPQVGRLALQRVRPPEPPTQPDSGGQPSRHRLLSHHLRYQFYHTVIRRIEE